MNVPPGIAHSGALQLQSAATDATLLGLASHTLDGVFWRSDRIAIPSAWWGHVPFAHWLVSAIRPGLLVELGTYAGVWYTAFCTAVQRCSTGTRCIAVDTWQGDAHGGFYGEGIYEDFHRFHDERFAGFSTLLRATFDAALAHVADGTVDLLHIDGLHTYEAVCHDYEAWLPKMSERAVVLFHDTEVRDGDFGVWRLWAELRERHPSFSFLHGHGLGVLAVGRDVAEEVQQLCACTGDSHAAAVIRERFARFGDWTLSEHRRCLLEAEAAQAAPATEQIRQHAAGLEQRCAEAERIISQAGQRADAEARLREAAEQTAQAAAQRAEEADGQRVAAEHAMLAAQRQHAEAGQAAQAAAATLAEAEREAGAARQRAAEESRRRAEAEQTAAQARQLAADEARRRGAAEIAAADWQHRSAEEERGRLQAEQAYSEQFRRCLEAERAAANAAQLVVPAPAPDPALLAEVDRLRRERAALLDSPTWRVAGALRTLGQRMPKRLHRPMRFLTRRLWSVAAHPFRFGFMLRRDLRAIGHSGLFDAAWYLREYPDVAGSGMDPVRHYAVHGAIDRRNPGPEFDVNWYLGAYPDVAASGLNPLLHYLRCGRREGRMAQPITPAVTASAALLPDPAARGRERRRILGLDIVPAPVADVAIGIVTYDTPHDELRRAVAAAAGALRQAGGRSAGRVFIIDNGSPTESEATVRLASRGNIGFGAGQNALMQAAFADGAEIFIAVNPDGLLHPDAVGAIVRMAAALDGRALIEAAQFPEEHPKAYDPTTFDTAWAAGACLAIPRPVFEATGGFDEGFFMYCEDVDLSWRVRAQGLAVKICPGAQFLHTVTRRQPSEAVRRMTLQAGWRLARKWGDPAFGDGCERELRKMGAAAGAGYVPQVPAAYRPVADFTRLFNFAPARW